MLNVLKLYLFFFLLETLPLTGDRSNVPRKTTPLSLSLRAACWETMMWFWKSSSVSGICTVVDTRLRIQRLQRKSDKATENVVRVWSPRSPRPQQTQMFWPDPDVPTFDPGGILTEELNPDPGLFILRMNCYYDSDGDMRKGRRGKICSLSRPLTLCLSVGPWRLRCSPCDQVCELV